MPSKTRPSRVNPALPSGEELRQLGEVGISFPLDVKQILLVARDFQNVVYAHQRNLELLETERDLIARLRRHIEEQDRTIAGLRRRLDVRRVKVQIG